VAKAKKKEEPQAGVNVLEKIFGTPQETIKAETSEAENVRLIISEWLDPKHIRRKTRLTKSR